MLVNLLTNRAMQKDTQHLTWQQLAGNQQRMAAESESWVPECLACVTHSISAPGQNIYNMVNNIQYHGGATELDHVLKTLQSNFNTQRHVFPHCGPYYVKYTILLLDTYSKNQNMALRQMAITDSAE
jgi:hypothetical protein